MKQIRFLLGLVRPYVFSLQVVGSLLLILILSTGCSRPSQSDAQGSIQDVTEPSQSIQQQAPRCDTWQFAADNELGTHVSMVSGVSALSSDDIWVVGDLLTITEQPLVADWNGTVWKQLSIVGLPSQGARLNAVVALSTNDVWAVGETANTSDLVSKTLIVHWDGQSLKVVDSPNPGTESNAFLGVAATGADNVWAVGYQGSKPLLARWNGSVWDQDLSLVGEGNLEQGQSTLVAISATPEGEIWAAGWQAMRGCCPIDDEPLITRWNGSKWEVIATPKFGGGLSLHSISVLSAHDVWVVGSWGLALHWDGIKWTSFVTPEKYSGNDLNSVAAIASNDVWAVGGSDTGGEAAPEAIHWDGSEWRAVTVPKNAPDQLFYDLAATSTDIWAVGGTVSGIEHGPWLPMVGHMHRTSCIPIGIPTTQP